MLWVFWEFLVYCLVVLLYSSVQSGVLVVVDVHHEECKACLESYLL